MGRGLTNYIMHNHNFHSHFHTNSNSLHFALVLDARSETTRYQTNFRFETAFGWRLDFEAASRNSTLGFCSPNPSRIPNLNLNANRNLDRHLRVKAITMYNKFNSKI